MEMSYSPKMGYEAFLRNRKKRIKRRRIIKHNRKTHRQ